MGASFELSLQTSFLMCSSVLRVLVLHSNYGDSSLSKKLNGHKAFESISLFEALISFLK